jgi:hypothetical protein
MRTIASVLTACVLASVLGVVNQAQAQPPAEFYLGEAHVDGGHDHDNIKVAADLGPFRAIQIRVQESGIHFDHVIVHYRDGQSEPIQIRNFIPAGQQTRVIELPGGPRMIRRVEFYYDRAHWRGPRPRVRVFGFR